MPNRTARWLRRLLYLALLPFVLFAGFLILDNLYPLQLPGKESFAVVVTAKDGTPLRSFADARGVWRYPVSIKDVSPRYLDALLNYEDRWFWKHPGVNPLALGRAVGQWIWFGKPVSGGSTLTMQVARILQPNKRSITGKLQQMFHALQLEWHLDKRQILTLYLNHAPFGGPLEGVQAASYAYLGKSAKHLSYAEAALLAVLPQSPTSFRPDRNPKAAQRARDKVLDRLQSFHTWSEKTVQQAKAETVAAWSLERPMLAPLLARRLKARATPGAPLRTTIDASLQAHLGALVRDYTLRLPGGTSAAALVVDNRTREVLAYVGSAEFTNRERYGYVDMVQAIRSPGSTLKPFLYGYAIEEGLIHSASLLLDTPQSFDGYRPGDFSGDFAGPVTATAALQRSLNIPAVDLLHRLGPDYFASRLRQGGLKLSYPGGAAPNLSMILGGVGTSLENLVAAYTALAREGESGELRFMSDDPIRNHPMLKPGVAWIVRHMLSMDAPFAASHKVSGTQVAWKTGTSYGFRDAWSIGVSNHYTIGIWVGRPDGTPTPGQYGAVTAAPLMFNTFALLPADRTGFPAAPASVSESIICWPLGKRMQKNDPYCQQKHQAFLYQGMAPATFPDRSDDKWLGNPVTVRINAKTGRRISAGCNFKGKAINKTILLWPKAARPWLTPEQRRESKLPRLDKACRNKDASILASVQIMNLPKNATVRPAAGSKDARPTIMLQAQGGSGPIHWLLDGQQVAVTRSGAIAYYTFLNPGKYRLTAMDEEGNFDAVEVTVLAN